MNSQWRSIICLIVTLVAHGFCPSAAAQRNEYNVGDYRIGIGHNVSSNFILNAPLRTKESNELLRSSLNCPNGSMLRTLRDTPPDSLKTFFASIQVDTLFPARGNLKCANREIAAKTYLEILGSDGVWAVVKNPNVPVFRHYLDLYANSLLNRDKDGSYTKSDVGFKISLARGTLSTSCTIITTGFVCAYTPESSQHREDMRYAFESLGFSLVDHQDERKRLFVNYGHISTEGIVESFRKMILYSPRGLSLTNSLKIMRMEQGFGERLSPNWREQEARKAFSGK